MSQREVFVLMAAYNAAMNQQLYAAAATLPDAALTLERQAFFGSILGTLNHIAVADTIWLQRFAGHRAGFGALAAARALPTPSRLDQALAGDLAALRTERVALDAIITALVDQLREEDLAHILRYTNSRGAQQKHFGSLLLHFFNHQTHHRGQASTLLFQAGVDIGVTDLLALIPNEDAAERA